MTYKAPVRDLMFALEAAAEFGRLASLFPGADAATVEAVLEGAGALCVDVLAPLNHTGDVAGARFAAPMFVAAALTSPHREPSGMLNRCSPRTRNTAR